MSILLKIFLTVLESFFNGSGEETWLTNQRYQKPVLCNFQFLLFSHQVLSDSATPQTAVHQASLSFIISWEFAQTHVHWVGDAI